jgi:hypothetical protein
VQGTLETPSSEHSRTFLCDSFQNFAADSATSSGNEVIIPAPAIPPLETSMPNMSCILALIVDRRPMEAPTKMRTWCMFRVRYVCRDQSLAGTECSTSTGVFVSCGGARDRSSLNCEASEALPFSLDRQSLQNLAKLELSSSCLYNSLRCK